jgi:hypothetical protein
MKMKNNFAASLMMLVVFVSTIISADCSIKQEFNRAELMLYCSFMYGGFFFLFLNEGNHQSNEKVGLGLMLFGSLILVYQTFV